MHLVGEVIIKGADRSDLAGPGGRVEAVVGIAAILVADPVTAEIGHVAVDVRQGDAGDKVQIDVPNVDLIQRKTSQRRVSGQFEIAEKISQVQEIFIHCALGVGFDRLMVRQKITQNLWSFRTIISHRSSICGNRQNRLKTAFPGGASPPN